MVACVFLIGQPERARTNVLAPQQKVGQQQVQVSRDSLESMIRFLSVDPGTGVPRSRFTFRESELGEIAESLAARLERSVGAAVDRLAFTIRDSLKVYSNDSTFTAENIVARLQGTGMAEGVVLVTAHYDAIGIRSADIGWIDNWESLEAPGADDNGTGVAALMETARVLPHHSLPFDVLFVLFSAEELGKIGSEDFVERYEGLYGEKILAVLNVDMIGYAAEESAGGDIISNYRSGWIAELLTMAAAAVDPDLRLGTIKPGPSNYDHGPFWLRGLPAVSIAEPLESFGFIVYPYYHTVNDLIEHVDLDQVCRITGVLVDFLTRYAERTTDVALLQSDIFLMDEGHVTEKTVYDVGDTVTVLLRIRNIGGAMAPAWANVHLEFTAGTADGERMIYNAELIPPRPLQASELTIPVPIDGRFGGAGRITATITVDGYEDDAGNNRAELFFGVNRSGQALIDHGIRPNPVRTSFGDASFCLNLADEVDCSIKIYTLEGELIASADIGPRFGLGVGVGLNCFDCGDLFAGIGDLASGIYLYRILVFDSGGESYGVTGGFAIEH